ncbi:MAG: hypothetical protein MZV65_51675 [Chromatiales bacterium]|nr:hypothetical protein [Chromatiales bacterium]
MIGQIQCGKNNLVEKIAILEAPKGILFTQLHWRPPKVDLTATRLDAKPSAAAQFSGVVPGLLDGIGEKDQRLTGRTTRTVANAFVLETCGQQAIEMFANVFALERWKFLPDLAIERFGMRDA